jgi:hypothetical protein
LYKSCTARYQSGSNPLKKIIMKKLSILVSCLLLATVSMAQLNTTVACPGFEVDILDGKVNGFKPNVTAAQIKSKFPCFTSEVTDSARCGEAVYYKDKGISFYTKRDYVEIVEGFKGKMSISLLGTPRGSLFKTLGNPQMKDAGWDAYQTAYGVLVLYFNKANKVRKIIFSTNGTSTLSPCE